MDNIHSQSVSGEGVNLRQIFINELFTFSLKAVIGRDIESIYVEEIGSNLSKWEIYEILVADPMEDVIDKILRCIRRLQVALVNLEIQNEGLIIPGYTHLQIAQPLLLQHLLLSYVEQLERDSGRLVDCKARMNFSPLGACALAGTGLPIDRFATSMALRFSAPLRNSVDAVSDGDFLL